MYAKNGILICCSLLDICGKVEWPRFLVHPVHVYAYVETEIILAHKNLTKLQKKTFHCFSTS